MTLPPFTHTEAVMTRSVLPFEMREPSAVTPAQRATFLGIRAPVRACEKTLRGLADADGTVFALLLPAGSPGLDRERAEMLAAAINAGLGVAGLPVSVPAE
ncbi:hypothetical protein [Methylobacterium radiotolerans]|uniref:Uncharacterized protein n=1 Tax=Methylobacterium radiotolerans (strain ATCC 27329 / DSM 1819 / JCM 2831 / NBRC 15690 / NCIMB 10815 / 0-1) TaxID=426355 RepID=B1M2N5_METRJ|nr:hypothetical protein [Methylobacterium radiotolerans]ACB27683.1 hypothetical protein Mrad2831_5738 [Methylobacterium radiotolerans JCM 2831]GEM95875.1 hypothetical protein MRA01_04150 [Methylobacterium radiotolerans]